MTAVTPLPIRPFADSTDSLLRFAMRLDATLSGLAGLMIAAAADPISSLTGLSSIAEYGLGAFFVFCGLIVFGLAAAPDLRRAGIGVAIANIVFTVAAVVVVAADVLPLTATGIGATLAWSVYTALLGYLQDLGVRRLPA
jgi:GNAT superfamily N-acetyltransferase